MNVSRKLMICIIFCVVVWVLTITVDYIAVFKLGDRPILAKRIDEEIVAESTNKKKNDSEKMTEIEKYGLMGYEIDLTIVEEKNDTEDPTDDWRIYDATLYIGNYELASY